LSRGPATRQVRYQPWDCACRAGTLLQRGNWDLNALRANLPEGFGFCNRSDSRRCRATVARGAGI